MAPRRRCDTLSHLVELRDEEIASLSKNAAKVPPQGPISMTSGDRDNTGGSISHASCTNAGNHPLPAMAEVNQDALVSQAVHDSLVHSWLILVLVTFHPLELSCMQRQ
jgi:hypothetical protein